MPSWNNTDLTYLLPELYRCKETVYHFLSCFKASIIYLSINFRKFVLVSCISKRIRNFLFLSDMSEKQESTISESSTFTGSICRIWKTPETTSLLSFLKHFLLDFLLHSKQFNLIDLSCCGKYNLIYRLKLWNLKKPKSYFSRKIFVGKAIEFDRSFVLWHIPLMYHYFQLIYKKNL